MNIDNKHLKETIPFQLEDFKINAFVDSGRVFESAFHEAIEIKYYQKGGSTISVNSNTFEIEEGDVTVINPYEIHSCIDAYGRCEKEYKIFIDVGFLTDFTKGEIDLRKELIANGKRINNVIKNNKRIQEIIVKIYDENTLKKSNYKLAVYALVTELFVILLREYSSTSTVFSDDKNLKRIDVISPALNKIFKDYSKKITLDELANLCRLSKYHFCHAFKKQMGVTPVQYLINYRISVASAMLERSDNNVENIAYQCGFDDISYFYRCYKKLKGVSPKNNSK